MMQAADDVLARARRLRTSFNSLLKYWALYRAADESARLAEFISQGDFETNAVQTVKVGMLRLVVLNLRRALEPPGERRWSLMGLLSILPTESVRELVSNQVIDKVSAYKTIDRRVSAVERARSLVVARYHSPDASWIKQLRDDDVAHSEMGSDIWHERSAAQLHEFVMGTSDEALQLVNALNGVPNAKGLFSVAHTEAAAFWDCFEPPEAQEAA